MTNPEAAKPESLPFDDLHRDLEAHPEGRAALLGLRDTVDAAGPARSEVESHVGVLRGIPVVASRVANWFDSPATQRWLGTIADIGL